MAECPDGRTNRGTRSQFRVGLPGLGLCKGFYPINLGKIMDGGQSSQISSSSSSSTNITSPYKGTHTLTVREYEQTIYELKKENFDLKLKLYVCDETHMKNCRDKDSAVANDQMVQVIVHLKSQSEALESELKEKEKLLQDALERAEKLESDFKELEKLNADLQSQVNSFSELPSKEEILLLLEEKENLVNHTESLESLIKEKEEEIDTLNQKIEFLANENTHLEEKIKKRSIAIQGFVYKNFKEQEMLPDEIKNIVISAIQAAKNKNKDDLAVSLKTFSTALTKVMSASDVSRSEEKENIKSPKEKCLKGEVAEKSSDSFLSSHTESPSHTSQIQDFKVLSERNLSDTKQAKILDSSVYHPIIRKEMLHQSAVDIPEKDVIEFCDISPSTEENLMSFTERLSLQTFSVSKPNLIDIETVSSLPEKDTLEPHQFVNIVKENKQLKRDLEEKLAVINDLRTVCKELKGVKTLQDTKSDAFRASQKYCVATQTKIGGSNLLDECDVMKLQRDAKLSDNVEELRENILLLLLAVEEKNKELSEVKESLVAVQKDMKKAMSTTSIYDKDFYLHERNELHERLALSCSVNQELMRYLKNLEKFMEDLLQHKFDSSSLESIDKSGFMSSVSRCLNESLKLSRTLSDQLSICEGSKLFEEYESFAFKNGSNSEEKDVSYLSHDKLSMVEQQSSYFGSRKFQECLSYVQKNNHNSNKESDSSQLCWRCWQQLNPPLNQSEVSHLMQKNALSKPAGYLSSDSDIWSEPDRNVSMQRIGISLQNSPVSTKSPRKLRQRDKRMSSRISSKEDTSSSEYQQAFKKRQGSASRRLSFVKEDAKTQDCTLEKSYFLVAEKYSKLKSLLDDLGNIQDAKLSDDGWMRLNRLVFAAGETLQKLHFAQENAKTSSVCGKCVMLELFSSLKASHVEEDFFIDGTSSEQKILQEFSRELFSLKEACKEPFSLLCESVDKKSIETQSDILTESDQIRKLETVIKNLNVRNKKLDENLENINCILLKEKEELMSTKAENSNLLNKIDNLKIDLLDMKYKEKQLVEDLSCASKSNSEMNSALKDLEQKNEESTLALNQLTTELEEKRLELTEMNKKCLNYEKQLNEQIHLRENNENKLKMLESELLSEKNYLLHKIEDLNAEKSCSIQEMKAIQEERLALEKENAVINDRLISKNNELLSLKRTVEKLQCVKETRSDIDTESVSKEKIIFESIKAENFKLLNEINHLKEQLLEMKYKDKESSLENKNLLEKLDDINKKYLELNLAFEDLRRKMEESCSTADQLRSELQKNRLELTYMNKKCSVYEKELDEQTQIKEKCENKLKSLETYSATERENYLKQLAALNEEKNLCMQELKIIKEKMLLLEKENVVINNNFHSKSFELSSLEKSVEELQNDKKALISDNKAAKRLLSESKQIYETENNKLLNQINQLKEELSHMEINEKEISLKNKKFVDELMHLRKNNSELSNSLKSLEQKSKETSFETDQLTSDLQKCKTDLILLNEKCIQYEKQLNEQNHMRQNSEFKLKNLEAESLSDRNYYSHKIEDFNAERNQYIQELKTLQEEKLALEKENAVINYRLQSKSNELLAFKGTLEKLQSLKETESDKENESVSKEKIISESIKAENFRLLDEINHLKEVLLDMKFKEKDLSFKNKKFIEELDLANKNYSEVRNSLKDLQQKYNETTASANQLKDKLQEKKSHLSDMNKKCIEYEAKLNEQIQQKENTDNELKTLELKSLSEKENYVHQLNVLTAEKNHLEQDLQAIKEENLKLSSQINRVKEELSNMKNKEKELCLKNEKLVEELNEVSKSNSELSNTLKVLEQSSKDSNKELDDLAAELQKNRSELVNLSKKCLTYEKELNKKTQLKEKYENDLKTQEFNFMKQINHYLSQINDLNAEKDQCLQQLQSIQEKKIILEKEITSINDRLEYKGNKICSLQKTVEELQKAKEELDSNYEELQCKLVNSQECQTNLQEKCKKCEEIILKYKESESGYFQKLKQLEAKSKSEEEIKINKISALTKERDDILLKLKSEKECNKKLKAEKAELNENHLKSSQQIPILKQRIEFFENALLSSNKECESLNKDLKCLRNTLQSLESKCVMYEKQLVATAGMKDNLTECLLNINNEFSIQRQKLNEMCKIYGNDESVVWDETSFTKFMPVIDDDNVSKLCENIVSETKKLSQSVDMLLSILKSYHLKSIESETSDKNYHMKADNLEKELELYETEVKNLRLQNDQLQKSLSEKEKSIQSNAYEIKSLKAKLQNSQKEVDRENQLIQRKDDEITMLQERIFNLQTHVNSIMADKRDLFEKTASIIQPENFLSSNNQLPSKIVSTDNKICQTDEYEGLSRNLDESFTSVSSHESLRCHGCEKYWKKCYSLQTKLVICQKQIDILEKDKKDLKDRLLQQLQSKKDLVETSDSSVSKLSELESKLEKKKLFISELKSELLKTCNALIDKEKEVDDLKQNLAECTVKYQHGVTDISTQHAAEILNSVDANVKTLKDHKWKLIQTIFDMQRKFYEKKGIHLNYFDKFKEHVNNLYSLQLIPSMSKSQSMPVLRSHALKGRYEQGNEKVKRLADLELDIECLENLKIFLNRFLVPCVIQTSETCDKETKIKQQAISSDSLLLLRETESLKESKHVIADILNLSFPDAFIKADDGKTLSIDDIAVTISQHLDSMQKFFESVTKMNWLEIVLNICKDSVDKVAVKTLLLKIFQEINVLHERADKLFNFNTHLKSFDFVSSLHVTPTSKLDTSDRESIMSEETIAVSRTDSPLSFEDICPIKLPHPDTLHLDEISLKPGSTRSRVTVIAPYSTKMAVVHGSCDSVCQRSHYSSPDLGIESDPNHDSSAPEHKEDGTNKFTFKLHQTKTAFTSVESAGRWSGPKFGDTCYAIGTLKHFELLKQEIKESLVAIKSVLSRTGDGLHHIAKYTSPRKTLEYNTLKSIKDTCVHMEVCLKEANNLVGQFWTAPCPTEKEWKMLKEENQKLSENLASLRILVEKQENEFKTAIEKLERAQAVKDNIEKKISKKLVKTKKLIRQAELRLLETGCQNIPPVPKYPSEQTQEADAH